MQKRKVVSGLIIVFAVVAGLALLWKVTPLAHFVQPERLAKQLEDFASLAWSPLIFIAGYVVGGLVMFPVTVLGAATAIIFPPFKAIGVSFTGIMLSAALLYGLGARFLRGRARKALGPTIDRVDRALSDRGIITIAALRMIPLAPFTLVNIAVGAVGVPFRDYMLGTALGLAPGITMVCVFGRQVRAFWKDPNVTGVLVALAVMLVWIGMSLTLQRWVSHRKAAARAS